jgi:quercetin dioxygenase-like cupin family protein
MGDDVRHRRSADPSHLTASVSTLLRWELQGGVWRVLGRDGEQVTIGLFTCDAGEEMDRFTSADEQLLAVVDGRSGSEA